MAYESYKISLPSSTSVRNRMLSEKERQIRFLYDQAMDREEDVLLNGIPFTESPRIFDRKFVDTFHHKITVETILDKDWIECGDYLEYEGMVWLCLNSYSFHKLYCRATFMSCDWKIYWINENGELKSQYVIDQNSTQYNSGETSNSTMTIGSAQHMLKMQCNDDTILLDSPMRFAIDKNIKKPTCYKVTQNDNTAYNYGKGLCCVTVTETPLNKKSDKLITLDNGAQVWICDYIKATPLPSEQTTDLSNEKVDSSQIENKNIHLKISYDGDNYIFAGGEYKTFTVIVSDNNSNLIDDVSVQWSITALPEVKKYISYDILESNSLKIKSSYHTSVIGTKILLTASVNEISESIYVEIGGGI